LPDPFAAADAVFSLFNRGGSIIQAVGNIFGGGGSSARNRDSVQSLVGLSNAFNARANVAIPAGISPSRRQVADNAAALNNLFSNAVLVQAAGMTAAMDLPVYDDAVAVRVGVTGALDQQSLNASDAVYRATQDLRTKVHRDVTSRQSNSARMNTITPRMGASTLVLAYERYDDVSREDEIVGINGVRRPGFLSTNPIKVLSA
jgi:prophage DNA circulation protein